MTNSARSKIVEILCRRDGMTVEEANALINLTIEEIEEANGDYEEVIEIMMNNLGLEPDFILDLLF